ncbi:AI-2E family transporter [soil metagenome]
MISLPNTNQKFVRRVLTIVAIIIAALLFVLLVYYAIDIILLLFAAVLIAIFLRGLGNLTRRYTKLSEGLSVVLVSFLLLIILGGAIALLAPSVAEQVNHLRDELPKSAQNVSEYISEFSWGKAIIAQLPSVNQVINSINTTSFLSSVGGFFSTTAGAVANFLIVILVAIYLATEPQTYIHGFVKLFPIERRTRVREILAETGDTLSWWLIGKMGSMLVIGLMTWIGLYFLGVPLSLTLGLIAGLLSFIPNFGPILSAIPAILLAFIESPIKALYVLILYVVVQLIESNLITPMIERETVELPPALTIIAQLALGVLIGGLGLILATPMLAVVMVLVQMVYIQDVLGDKNTEANEVNEQTEETIDEKVIEENDDLKE